MARQVMTAGQGRRWLSLASLAVAWLVPLPLWAADGPLPEVLLVVDTSASMQFKAGADSQPVCDTKSGQDSRSRWVQVREMIGGTFLGYSCVAEPLAPMSEAVSPPAPQGGPPKCIPGLAMVTGTSYQWGLPSLDNAGTSSPAPVSQTLSLPGTGAAKGEDLSVPWLLFDWSAVGATADLVAGSVRLQVAQGDAASTAKVRLTLTMVPGNVSPSAQSADFCCKAANSTRTALSAPTEVSVQPGSVAEFTLTDTGLAALRAALNSGDKPYLTVTYSDVSYPDNCNLKAALASVVPGPPLVFANPSGTSAAPRLVLTSGSKCPSEGPAVHAVAWGIDDKGATSAIPFGRDGLLDVFGPTTKFALLVSDPVLNKVATSGGGYSFGSNITSYWGDINLGMQDPFVSGSASVAVPRSDALAARAAAYNQIQQSLAALRPNGSTPLGAQLQDALDYFGPSTFMDPHFKTVAQDPVQGDPYHACRERLVVVFSDGGANLLDGTSDGRQLAIEAAAKLAAAQVPVYVVAVGHPSEAGAGPPTLDLQFLNDLAAAGGSSQAILAHTAAEAVKGLAAAIAAAKRDARALTRPTVTLATGAEADVQHSFQALSVFDISQPLRTHGILEQRVFSCSASCKDAADPNRSQVCEVLNLGARLQSRSVPRKLYTHTGGGRLALQGSNLPPEVMGIGTVGLQPRLLPDATGLCVTQGAFDMSIDTERQAFRDSLIDLVAAKEGTCRQGLPLGAPSYAQPAVLEPADRIGLREPSFQSYVKTTVPTSANYSTLQPPGSAGRPTLLLAATHDGLLHAFRTDRNPKIKVQDNLLAGDELWAFLPRFSLQRLASIKLVTSPEASYLGGAISTAHVQLHRTAAMSAGDLALQWRAVAIAGAGDAGSGYVALDVTAPEDPQLLWEINPERHCWGPKITVNGVPGPQCVATETYLGMGRSVAKAAIVNLFYSLEGEPPGQHAAVVLPMGKPPSQAAIDNQGVDGLGERGVMVLDLESGRLLRRFATEDMDLSGFAAAIEDQADLGYFWTDPGCYNTSAGQLTTRCFLGDSRGMMWRLDLSGSQPAQWKLAFFHDAYGGPGAAADRLLPLKSDLRAPVRSAPSVATDSSAQVVIGYGTGDLSDAASETRRHIVYSLTEVFDAQGDGTQKAKAQRNWYKVLQGGERFVGPPLTFAFYTYWASFVVQADGACETGSARLWGARFEKPQSPSDPTDLDGAFANPASPALKSSNLDQVTIGADKPSPVSVLAVPACRGACSPTDYLCLVNQPGGVGLGNATPRYELGVATANAQAQSAGQTPKAGVQPGVGTLSQQIPQPRSAAVVTGWDVLVD